MRRSPPSPAPGFPGSPAMTVSHRRRRSTTHSGSSSARMATSISATPATMPSARSTGRLASSPRSPAPAARRVTAATGGQRVRRGCSNRMNCASMGMAICSSSRCKTTSSDGWMRRQAPSRRSPAPAKRASVAMGGQRPEPCSTDPTASPWTGEAIFTSAISAITGSARWMW